MIAYVTKTGQIIGGVYGTSRKDLSGITSLCGGDYAVFVDDNEYPNLNIGSVIIQDILPDNPSLSVHVATATGTPNVVPVVVDIVALRANKIAEINKICGEKIDSGYYSYAEGTKNSDGTYRALLYKSDITHQLDMIGMLTIAQAGGTCTWKDASIIGECHEVSADVIKQLYTEMVSHITWCKTNADKLCGEIMTLTTAEQINGVKFSDEPMPTYPTV